MSTVELNDLETQIDHLMRSVEQLKLENHSLKTKLAMSFRERTHLQSQLKMARERIVMIISKLKEELP